MSTEVQDAPTMGTQPVAAHDWLKKLLGSWKVECEIIMEPDQPPVHGIGTETVIDFGGLWAITDGSGTMPDGNTMQYKSGLGYDVSFNEYRGFWIGSVSSHLWKQTGELSADGKTMTLHCVGPHMTKDGETANYKDVIEIVDDNHRTMTSWGQDDEGNWCSFMTNKYTRLT